MRLLHLCRLDLRRSLPFDVLIAGLWDWYMYDILLHRRLRLVQFDAIVAGLSQTGIVVQ